MLSSSFVFYFTDAPRRQDMNGYPLKAPILEDCRMYLLQWAKQIKNPNYAIVYDEQVHYARFNEMGEFEFYNRSHGIKYIYETPCDFNFKVFSLDTRFFNVSYQGCTDLYFYLLELDRLQNPPFKRGPFFVNFCYTYGWNQAFPSQVPTPKEFVNYRIRPSYFHYNSTFGRIFVSPTLATYQRFMLKEMPYIDDGTPDPDYVYDYW